MGGGQDGEGSETREFAVHSWPLGRWKKGVSLPAWTGPRLWVGVRSQLGLPFPLISESWFSGPQL